MFTQSISTGESSPSASAASPRTRCWRGIGPLVGLVGQAAGFLKAIVDGVPFLAELSWLHDAPLEREPPEPSIPRTPTRPCCWALRPSCSSISSRRSLPSLVENSTGGQLPARCRCGNRGSRSGCSCACPGGLEFRRLLVSHMPMAVSLAVGTGAFLVRVGAIEPDVPTIVALNLRMTMLTQRL